MGEVWVRDLDEEGTRRLHSSSLNVKVDRRVYYVRYTVSRVHVVDSFSYAINDLRVGGQFRGTPWD